MRARSIASLALKLLGIYALLLALTQTQMLLTLVAGSGEHGGPTPWVVAAMIAPFLLLTAAGTALISLSRRLVVFIVSEQETQCPATASMADMQAVGFSVAGVMVLSRAIPKLFQILTNVGLLRREHLDAMTERTAAGVWSNVLALVVEVSIGLGLFLGARGLAHMWQRLQDTRPMK